MGDKRGDTAALAWSSVAQFGSRIGREALTCQRLISGLARAVREIFSEAGERQSVPELRQPP